MKHSKILLLIPVFLIILCVSVNAQTNYPNQVRVGLYHSNVLNSVDLSSDTGLEVSSVVENNPITLFSDTSLKIITVKKDNYTFDTKISNPGAYHIQLQNTYEDYISAQKVAKVINERYTAYPVYDGQWRVWVGLYSSETLANANVSKLKSSFSSYTYTVVKPNIKNVQIIEDNQVKLIFAYDMGNLQISPINSTQLPNIISVNDIKYRGAVRIIRQVSSDMTIINVLDLEQYLYSVVASEMSTEWNIEALKAQAVAARTYAVNILLNSQKGIGKYIDLGFDMTGTVEYQAYKGYSREDTNSKRAVDETKGLVAYYNNIPIGAYFFSSSGGYTENSENVWVSQVPYLKAVEDKYLPNEFNKKTWTNTATPEEVKAYMLSKGVDLGDILDVKVEGYTKSGNALKLKVIGTKATHEYNKDNIRLFMRGFKDSEFLYSQTFTVTKSGGLSYPIISSKLDKKVVFLGTTKYVSSKGISTIDSNKSISIKTKNKISTLKPSPNSFVFSGRGWGHGVGMSQWGAKGMADAGFKFNQILKHYYTDIEIK